MVTKREKLIRKLEAKDAENLPETSSQGFFRYLLASMDKFEEMDWDVMKSIYSRAVINGDIVKR